MMDAGSEADSIWDEARKEAKDQLGEAAISGMPPEFIANNPYEKGTPQHEEYEAAFEHFIMTGLGY
jgi:hypothetical protein